MLKRFLYRLLERRHYWRYVGFDELSELYTSMMLRSMGLSLIGIFVPIYLYMNDYALVTVFLFMAGLFTVRLVADVFSGFLVGHIGPKRSILISNVLQVVSLVLLLTLPEYQWPLWWIALAWGASTSLFYIAYHVNFSKIIHPKHGGKELGMMTIVERLGAALGPLAGGIVATAWGAEYTIGAAVLLFVLSSIPLLLTPEVTKTRQKITFKGLRPWRFWRDWLSFGVMGYSNTIAIGLWPLYLAVAIFTTNAYASVGIVTSIGVVAAILAAKFIGLLVDRRKGRWLLRGSVFATASLHLVRPFIGGIGGAAVVNAANNTVATGTRLPYFKGMYDRADSLPGFRIAYIVFMEMIGDIGKVIAWLIAALLAHLIGALPALTLSFVIGGVVAIGIMIERFPALAPRRFL